MVRRLAGWALLLFALYLLLSNPDGAAGLVVHLANGLRSAAHSLSSFVTHL